MDHVTSDGVRLYVEAHGEDDRPAIVLTHGLSASTAMWQGLVPVWVGRGLRVVAYDVRAHGRSDAPYGEEYYGDARLAQDLIEVVAAFATSDAVAVGYSMGAAITLKALEAGLDVRRAVVGAAAPAVLAWTDADDQMRRAAVAALRGDPGASPQTAAWASSLSMGGTDVAALADLLEGHRPVVEHWDRITIPVTVLAGDQDVMAAPASEVGARLVDATVIPLAGDHFSAFGSRTFVDAVTDAAS
jgi:pimeloyl-ACP methyl ester carboxylesterase